MCLIGPLHDPVTWYKITHADEQVAPWDFQNKGGRSSWTGTSCICKRQYGYVIVRSALGACAWLVTSLVEQAKTDRSRSKLAYLYSIYIQILFYQNSDYRGSLSLCVTTSAFFGLCHADICRNAGTRLIQVMTYSDLK